MNKIKNGIYHLIVLDTMYKAGIKMFLLVIEKLLIK